MVFNMVLFCRFDAGQGMICCKVVLQGECMLCCCLQFVHCRLLSTADHVKFHIVSHLLQVWFLLGLDGLAMSWFMHLYYRILGCALVHMVGMHHGLDLTHLKVWQCLYRLVEC